MSQVAASSNPLKSLSHWGGLEPQPARQPVIGTNDVLTLSLSQLQQYVNCPRQFFYAARLRLPGHDTPAAWLGRLMHATLDQLHKLPLPEQTPDRFMTLLEQWFKAAKPGNDRETSNICQWLADLPALSRRDVIGRTRQTAQALTESGWFQQLAQEAVETRSELAMTWQPAPLTRISARLDLVWKDKAGLWHIVDYKLYGPHGPFRAKQAATLVKRLCSVLNGLPVEAEGHRERFVNTDSKPLLYQMPVYWLAATQSGLEPLGSFRLMVLRPDVHGGVSPIVVDAADLTDLRTVVDDMLQHILNPIRQACRFVPAPDETLCRQCSYRGICPKA